MRRYRVSGVGARVGRQTSAASTLAVLLASVLLGSLFVVVPEAHAQALPQIVVSEIHYHPQAFDAAFPDYDDREKTEFIEIMNLESSSVNLTGWCFDDGVDYCFGAGVSIGPSSTLVIADDAVAFDDLYGFTPHGVYLSLIHI